MWIDTPPARCHPLVYPDPTEEQPNPAPKPDLEVTVEVFPVRADLVADCAAWCGGIVLHVNQLPAVLLPGGQDVAGLGDYALRHGDGQFARDVPSGFDQRYVLADPDATTPG